jgi:hypothetical protein
MITVYSTVFGDPDRDFLRPPPKGCSARYICFSDHRLVFRGWEVRVVPPPGDSPTLSARLCKMRPDVWIGPEATTIWLDASCALRMPASAIVKLSTAPVMGFNHPRRKNVLRESEVVIKRGNADPDAVQQQMATYKAEGFPIETHPVTTTGMLVRTPEAQVFNQAWEAEIRAHTQRDQLSVDYVGWKTRTKIGWLEGSYLDNAYMKYFRHVGRGEGTLV